ncbi:MAG: dihydropteroate synthase [Deferribacterales bacterium]
MLIDFIVADKERLEYEIDMIGAHPYAKKIADKGLPINVKLRSIMPAAANIIKQEAIASGIDAVVHIGTIECKVDKTDVLISGNKDGFKKLVDRLKIQPYSLKGIAEELETLLRNVGRVQLKIGDDIIDLTDKLFMPILNVTPDSFSDGGKFNDLKEIERYLIRLKELGINIIDIGGESTRPGSESVEPEEELKRVLPAVELAVGMGFIVSVDTYKSVVAEKVLRKGAKIINDIYGLNYDADMAKVCADYGAAVVVMHMKGEPKTMQLSPYYENLLEEVKLSIYKSIEKALNAGVDEKSIIIDPGFGFGKNLEHNYILLKYLKEFKSFNTPLLVGLSRKSMVGNLLNKPVEERLAGTIAVEVMALMNGADIIRAHDIDETVDLIKIFNFYNRVKV